MPARNHGIGRNHLQSLYSTSGDLSLCPPLSAALSLLSINDPSAGSPTDTLLRLLLPLNGRARRSFQTMLQIPEGTFNRRSVRRPRSIAQSVVATGGVYKGQGLIRDDLDESSLRGIPRSRGTIAALDSNGDQVSTITRPSRKRREIALISSMSRACSPVHLRASQTCYCSFSYGFKPPIPLRR